MATVQSERGGEYGLDRAGISETTNTSVDSGDNETGWC
jgi:hypothetical protein